MNDHSHVFIVGTRLTRDEFEAICADIGKDAPADSDLGGYGDKYGSFFWPQYQRDNPDHIILAARQARFFTLPKPEPKPEPAPPTSPPAKEGQLWEPCRCGREPVYMPLELCDQCWPKNPS